MAKLGLDSILVRDLINLPEQMDIYLGTAFWLKLIGGILAFILILISLLFSDNEITVNIYIVIIAAGYLFQSFEVIDFYFQSQLLIKYVSFCKVIQLFLSSLIKVYLILTESNLIDFVIVSLFDQIALSACLFIAYRHKKKSYFYKNFDFVIAKKLLKDSWPLIFSSIVIMIYMRIDQVVINAMLGPYAAGVYSAAVRLSEVWYFIPTLISTSLFPAIVNAKKMGEKLYYQRLQQLFTVVGWIAIGAAVIVSFLSVWMIELLYGKAYHEASGILSIHMWTGFFVSLGVVSGCWLTNESLQKIAFYRTFFGMVVNIVLIFLLIPFYGLIGAAVSTLVAQIMAALVFDLFSIKTRKIFYMKLYTLNPFFIKRQC